MRIAVLNEKTMLASTNIKYINGIEHYLRCTRFEKNDCLYCYFFLLVILTALC